MSETTDGKRAKKRRRFGRVFARKWPSGRKNYSAQWFDQTCGKRITRHFDSESDAKKFLDDMELQIVAKVYVTPPTQSEVMALPPAQETAPVPAFVEYARELLKNRLAATLAVSTVGLYDANLLALSGFYGARDGRPAARLDEVTIASFLDFRAWRTTKRNSPDGRGGTVSHATINRDGQFASRVLNEAVVDGHLAANPLRGLTKLKEPRRPRRHLTKEEIALVLQHAPKLFRPLVLAALYTGARKCELTRLRWNDIDFAQNKIALFRQKVGNADLLDLHPVLAKELRSIRAKRKSVKNSDFIFLSRRGTRFTNISKSWALALKGAELDDRGLKFHGLRHAFAVFFLTGGGAVPDLQQQLGHSSLATTELYARGLSERRRDTVLALDFTSRVPTTPAVKPHVAARRARRSA